MPSARIRKTDRTVVRDVRLCGQTTGPTDDLLITEASVATTRAITIDAPPAEVWPWVAQLGWERGGFYSYDGIENALTPSPARLGDGNETPAERVGHRVREATDG